MNSVEDTAQNMLPFGNTMQKIYTAQQIVSGSMSIAERLKKRNDVEFQNLPQELKDIRFSGQYTDIVFTASNQMTEKNIYTLCRGDENLYGAVMQTYRNGVAEGHLYRDVLQNGQEVYLLTDKGKELVNSESFKRQFELDQKNLFCKQYSNTAVVEFTGTKDDINVFRYTDKLNPSSLMGKNSDKLKKHIEEWKKFGFVSSDEKGNIVPTEKCLKYFAQQDIKGNKPQLTVSRMTPDNFNAINQKLQAAKAAEKVATEAVKQGANTAVKSGVSVATGATTAGISTAAMAVIELSKKGIEILNNIGVSKTKR